MSARKTGYRPPAVRALAAVLAVVFALLAAGCAAHNMPGTVFTGPVSRPAPGG
jgi:hypothetical protein